MQLYDCELLDLFTVSLHSPNRRWIPAPMVVQRTVSNLWKMAEIPIKYMRLGLCMVAFTKFTADEAFLYEESLICSKFYESYNALSQSV